MLIGKKTCHTLRLEAFGDMEDTFLFQRDSSEEDKYFQSIELVANLVIKLETAEDDFNASKKTLFATYVWSGSSILAKELLQMPDAVRGKAVLELGAAAGLPSITCGKLGAKIVCASDYPSPTVLDTLKNNIEINGVADKIVVKDHIWGEDVDPLLAVNEGEQFDLVLAAECLWKHECHPALLESIVKTLKPDGTLLVTYSHHIPDLEDSDDYFFQLCKQAGLQPYEQLTKSGKHMWKDHSVDIYLVKLRFSS